MDKIILEFTSCCRASGLRISTVEVLDCLHQLALIDQKDETVFHRILRANFAKSRREQAEFERLYQLFFREMKNVPESEQAHWASKKRPIDSIIEKNKHLDVSTELIRHLRDRTQTVQGANDPMDKALLDFIEGNPQGFIEAVHQINNQQVSAPQAVKSNLGQLAGRLEIMIAINRMKKQVVQFTGHHDTSIKEEIRSVETQVIRRLDKAMDFLNADSRPDNSGLKQTGAGDLLYPSIGEIPFANLTQNETRTVQDIIDQWVKKLEEKSSLRFSASKKGIVDVKKTIQRSARYLGVPIDIVRKDRPLRKGKIVTLCDVSGSVWSTARFMLNILYSLQSCFARVKSYVFIDSALDVTDFFLKHDANTAVKKVLNDPRINYNAKTDYGMTLQEYHAHHFHDLDKKTSLIIMGDGRSNYLNPREPVLEDLRERCRRLVWLNPEQERFWGTGDSEMLRYRNHCNEARPCGNLNQLIDFVQALIL